MKDYSYHKKVIDDVITKLNESDIDLYLICLLYTSPSPRDTR